MMKSIIRIGIVLFGLLPFIWLSWLSAAPNGERIVSWTAGERSSFITTPLPVERVSDAQKDDRGSFLQLTGEPTYIGVFSPSSAFTQATVTVEFDPHNAFAVELGGLTDLAAYAFDFHALSNRVVESLAWAQLEVTDDNILVFSKANIQATTEDFFDHQPDRSSIVTYRATLPGTYRDSSYTPLNDSQTFNVSLRGSHEYVTYIKNETFSLSVTYQDINRTYGEDAGYIHVVNEDGVVVAGARIDDDGNISENQTYATNTMTISKTGLPEGVYRVELSGTSDIVWRQFVTRQRYMSFKHQLFVADDVGYLAQDRQTSFVTNSKSLAFETLHADSAHVVTLGNEEIAIPSPHTLVRTTIEDQGTMVGKTDAGDVKMSGEGKFALTLSSFFDPDPRSLSVGTDLSDDAVQYLVTSLAPKQTTESGWRAASATFDLASLAQESGAYKFAFSLPGQAVDGEAIDLHRVTIVFQKEKVSIMTAMYEEMRLWYRALRDRL